MELKEVFEPVLTFIKNLQKKDKEATSKQAAKDRLKLVLMQDRASVSPDFFEMMKQEIIDVIKKYIEIDEESLEVELTRGVEVGLEGPALYANIPIKNVKPVAIKSDEEDNKTYGMSEEKAEEVAEKLLNHAEEVLNKAKEEKETSIKEKNDNEEAKEAEENKKTEEKSDLESVEKKKEEKKTVQKKTSKSNAKSSVKKQTTSKVKKDTKK